MFKFKLTKPINISNRILITLTYNNNVYFSSLLYTTNNNSKKLPVITIDKVKEQCESCDSEYRLNIVLVNIEIYSSTWQAI